jgi:hypothetical protein
MPPAGYALSAARGGENVQVTYREFVSSEDGDVLVSRLEGFPSRVIERLPLSAQIKASTVDHLFVLIKKDGDCTVYANELEAIAKTRVRRAFKAGEPVFEHDIIDIDELKYEGLEVPEDVGVFVVLSKGWRKGLYYDLGPIQQEAVRREYNLWKLLGSLYNYLLFQDLFKISDGEYEKLFASMWFPFLGLRSETALRIVSHVRNGWNPDDLLGAVKGEVRELLPNAIKRWKLHSLLSQHSQFFDRAIERFYEEDYISCSSILYPRIEGILRSIACKTGVPYKQSGLSEAPMSILYKDPETFSRVLPFRFREYLRTVYFKKFEPDRVEHISRNTIAHGLAPQDLFTEKAAVIAILIIEQIFFHFPSEGSQPLATE